MHWVSRYTPFIEKQLFGGTINRPVTRQSREILIEQADKVKAFLEESISMSVSHKITERVAKLAGSFVRSGRTENNIEEYHKI